MSGIKVELLRKADKILISTAQFYFPTYPIHIK
jgi:hypothetical protein